MDENMKELGYSIKIDIIVNNQKYDNFYFKNEVECCAYLKRINGVAINKIYL